MRRKMFMLIHCGPRCCTIGELLQRLGSPGNVLRDEAQLQEEADGTPAQALGQASGIVDGQVLDGHEQRMAIQPPGLLRDE
jgi:hypothetical protein